MIKCSWSRVGFVVTDPYVHAIYIRDVIPSNDEKRACGPNTEEANRELPGFPVGLSARDGEDYCYLNFENRKLPTEVL